MKIWILELIISSFLSIVKVDVSNVSLVEDGKPAKVGFKVEDGKKVRIFKKTGNKVGN